MVNYQLGKIYKIFNDEKTYYGSTCEPIVSRRLAQHISKYKRFLDCKGHYVTSFEILATGNYEIVLIENYPCDSKDELQRERFYIENNNCVNKFIPGRTIQEWCCQKYEELKQKKSEYYEENKKQIIKRIKKHYEEHKNEKAVYNKKYREINKEKINEKHICCICGSKYTTYAKSKHEKLKKHLEALNQLNNNIA